MTSRSKLRSSALTLLTTLASIACQDSSNDAKSAADSGAATPESPPQGYFFGPVGAEVSLSIGQESLTCKIDAPTPPAAYSHATFQLKNALDAAGSYDITLGSTPNGQTCKVYSGTSGTGAELSADGAVRIGCEWGFDLLGRSSDDTVQAYSNNSTGVVIGGSARTIGSSPATGDGRYVAFRAGQEGLAPGSSGARSIYWRDRQTGETRLVSHAPDGTPANADCWQPAISADGLKVAFYSSASNLVANDTNGENDIFVWSSADGSVTRVSVGPNGEEADGASQDPALSGDGHVVAFSTNTTTVVPTANDGKLAQKVVRIDLASGERTVVTRSKSTGNLARRRVRDDRRVRPVRSSLPDGRHLRHLHELVERVLVADRPAELRSDRRRRTRCSLSQANLTPAEFIEVFMHVAEEEERDAKYSSPDSNTRPPAILSPFRAPRQLRPPLLPGGSSVDDGLRRRARRHTGTADLESTDVFDDNALR